MSSSCAFCSSPIGRMDSVCWECIEAIHERIVALEQKLTQLLLALEHSRLGLKLVDEKEAEDL